MIFAISDIKKDMDFITACQNESGRDSIIHWNSMETQEKRIINVKVSFLKIGEIDTIKEQFTADVMIEASWKELGLILDKVKDSHYAEGELWDPCIRIENILVEQKDSGWINSTSVVDNEVYVHLKRRVRGIFMEKLELENFPFDVQDLTVKLISQCDSNQVEFKTEILENGVNINSFVDKQKWKLYTHVEVDIRNDDNIMFSKVKHPSISYMCQVVRRPGFFYWNVFLIMWGIASLSFTTFSVNYLNTHQRLQLTFTLILTTVAFKYVVNQSIPKISYLTYADKYILFSLSLLGTICIWHSVVPYIVAYGVLTHEYYVIFGFLGVYFVYHVLFVITIWKKGFDKRRKVKVKEAQFKAKLNKFENSAIKIYIP